MIDLTSKALPESITIDGRAFFIKTDHHTWLKFEKFLKARESFDAAFVFANEIPTQDKSHETMIALMEFARPQNELPRPIRKTDAIPIDYELDADLIYSAFMEQYKIDLVDEDIHWHKFQALLHGLSEDTILKKVMGYRCYEKTERKIDPYEEMKKAWRIEPQMTQEEKDELDAFSQLFEE